MELRPRSLGVRVQICCFISTPWAVKKSACNAGDPVQSLGQEDPLEKGMATPSSILAWRIPWREEPGGLLSRGSQRIGHG